MSLDARQILDDPALGRMVVHHRQVPGEAAVYREPAKPLHPELREALRSVGITRLYAHQSQGIDLVRDGRDVLLCTPTASGKTLLFTSTVLETLLEDRDSHALFLYPTKALARDQLSGFRQLAGALGALNPPRFEIYDGDTPPTRRKKIRSDPPHVLISNPDMLHRGLLAHHRDWEGFLSRLRWIVLDELHVYRGLFGAHVHHILARLQRICGRLGASPGVIAASATIGNPGEFAGRLVGRDFAVVDTSGAPRAGREVVFLNPSRVSPYTAAVKLVARTTEAGLRTIAFTKARRTTELLYSWLVQQDPALADRVAPYRAGYLPAERRRLESRLFNGELSAVLSTSALELGIDVGALDTCILVGYPGSLISSWQRIGRVGRRDRGGLVFMIAMPDALDQYVVHHPDLFFDGGFERAVLDPWNPFIADRHLICAASEHPLSRAEVAGMDPRARDLVHTMQREGRLALDAPGTHWFAFRRNPHREVNPRSAGEPFDIVDSHGKPLGKVDGKRVYHECHPGAIYLHGGRTFRIDELDREQRRVRAVPIRADYYTVVLGDKETEILERTERRLLGPFPVGYGRLRVTVRIREFQKKRLYDGEPFATEPLDIPPLVFETVGLWIEFPPDLPAVFTADGRHFMGSIHAAEHASIGLFPLLAIADRDDVGGISYTGHPQTGGPAIFLYDGLPGGAGLSTQAFADLETLLERTRDLVAGCPCEEGCPACIQSPKCGNGNKPLDKEGSIRILRLLSGLDTLEDLGVDPPAEWTELVPFVRAGGDAPDRRHGVMRAGNLEPLAARAHADEQRARRSPAASETPVMPSAPPGPRTLVFDLETQRAASEVGGWLNTSRMGLALAVVYDMATQSYRTYHEPDVDRLLVDLLTADRVVGFNLDRFDLEVLRGYTRWDLTRIRTLDLLGEIHRKVGFRLSLGHLSETNLGEGKGGEGLQSLQWWKDGRIDLIERYCKRDVELTRRLYELGAAQGFLLYRDRDDRVLRLPVDW